MRLSCARLEPGNEACRPTQLRAFSGAHRWATPGPAHGLDVDEDGHGTVSDQHLYQLIRQPGPIFDRRLDIEFVDDGVEAFVFTFG
jgi:hypothetical protein